MFQSLLSHLNWLHVLVATVAYFMLGAVWYGGIFSKMWVKGHKIDMNNPDAKKGAGMVMALSFIPFFVITFAAAIILNAAEAHQAIHAVKWGAFLGCGFAAPVLVINHLYLQKPLSIHIIDALFHVVGLIIASLILVLWR